MVAMMLSNQSYAAYVSGAFQSGQNDLHSVTLDWTNRSGSTSGVNPYVRSRMNESDARISKPNPSGIDVLQRS